MAVIYLIRHGQASFKEADYDKLSEKGITQASFLGRFWQSMPAISHVYSGTLVRHKQTLAHFLQGYQIEPSSTVEHAGFNELDHVDLLTCYDFTWSNYAQMFASINAKTNGQKVLQSEFLKAFDRWIMGKHDNDYKESWPQFKKRCIDALHDVIKQTLAVKKEDFMMQEHQDSKNLCVFTSGGVIAVIIQYILGLSDQKTQLIIQQLRNTGVTKILVSGETISIDFFNNYSHLTIEGEEWASFK